MNILYLSVSSLDHSLNAVYIKGLRANGAVVNAYGVPKGILRSFFATVRRYRAHRRNTDCVLVGYDSPWLVVWLRLLGRKEVIYNALCSVIERLVLSRGLASRHSLKYWYYWLQDFLACACAHLVMLESQRQIDFFCATFKVPRAKCFRAWTGVDEEKFFFDPSIKKYEKFTVIFRGRLLPEAGGEFVVQAAKLLESTGIRFVMHSSGQDLPKIRALIEELKPQNLTLVTDFLSFEEVRAQMQRAHVSLGQLSAHDRLTRTIPHKAYESLALKLPYLTARNPAVLELLTEGETCLACNPADAQDLANTILWARDHPHELVRIAEKGYRLYQEHLTSKKLARKLLERVQ